ncbi:MAG: hypothetical protein HKM93_00635 [Desulfobacteraceae bacterium]|nr:hypothetical protein [Desulfobacteraceae bacterium]
MDNQQTTDVWQLARFFLPLALQAVAQAFSHPLVAMVASRGPGGPLNMAGLAQSGSVMMFLGMFAMYYMTTGMVFAKTRQGYKTFWRVCFWTGFTASLLQAILCVPALSHILFGKVMGLPTSIESPARITLFLTIPLQLIFFLRIPYQVAMYNGRATGRASLATMGRIALTALLVPVFCLLEWVGPIWAVVCLTIPVMLETVTSFLFAKPFLRTLPPATTQPPKAGDMFLFSLPLSIGGYFLVLSAITLSAFIARAPRPELMLPVYFITLGIVSPLSYAATRLQAMVLAFPPSAKDNPPTLRFSVIAGIILGLIPLIFIISPLIEWYYVKLQKLAAADLDYVRLTAIALVTFPFAVALRAYGEGLAAWMKKPMAVLIGHGFYMMTVVACGFIALIAGLPGYMIGTIGLTLGSLASAIMIRKLLKTSPKKDIPVGQTTTAFGPLR